MKINVLDHISGYVSLSSDEQKQLSSGLQNLSLKKKAYLFTQGQVCSHMYFVSSGCLRMCALTKDGHEQVLQFAIGGWWLSDLRSFEQKTPSEYFIQATEDTEVISLSRSVYDQMINDIPVLETYFRIMMQKGYAAAIKKVEILLCMSAEERYQQFYELYPEFVQRIPQYMLASFLGFTPEFLSMLRAKYKQDS